MRERLLHRTCVVQVQGSTVCMKYSQWKSAHAGEYTYDQVGGRQAFPFRNETRLVWGPERVSLPWPCGGRQDWLYKTATMVAGQTWGATAYSDDRDAAEQALGTFAEFREMRDWRGVVQ